MCGGHPRVSFVLQALFVGQGFSRTSPVSLAAFPPLPFHLVVLTPLLCTSALQTPGNSAALKDLGYGVFDGSGLQPRLHGKHPDKVAAFRHSLAGKGIYTFEVR